jgi:DNA-binding HxlR family transcriptional regulator
VALRRYGQFCGFARALETVGERWALLIVRDLCVGPKRFTDLLRGLPGIPTNVLTARLGELTEDGVVQRRLTESGDVVYELTPYGRELEEIVVRLGRWGAKAMKGPRVGEVITVDSIRIALHSTFVPKAARGPATSFELRLGDIVVHARVAGGKLETGEGPLPNADAIFEVGPAMRDLMARALTPVEALTNGSVKLVRGKRAHLERFVELFEIGAPPAQSGSRDG